MNRKLNDWNLFEKHLDYLGYEYDSVKYNKVLAFDILMTIYNEDQILTIPFYSIFKEFFQTIEIKELDKVFRKKKLLATNKTKRADYYELYSSVLNNVKSFSYIELSDLKKLYRFKPNNIIVSLLKVIKLIKINKSIKKSLYISSKLCLYKNIHTEFNRILKKNKFIKTKKYLSFNSAISIENLITQIINNKTNIDTYSLTHEVLFGRYKLFIPLNYINGYNNCSNKILVWGDYSKNDLIKIYDVEPNRILISGNPKYQSPIKNIKTTFRSCLVILPRDIYHSTNLELLTLLHGVSSKLNIEISVKLHPSLIHFEEYNSIENRYGFNLISRKKTLMDCLKSNKYDFSIGFNTNAYYESLYYGLPFFRYEKKENEQFKGLKDKFNNSNELINNINEFKNKDKNKLESDIKEVLVGAFGIGINEYSKILN